MDIDRKLELIYPPLNAHQRDIISYDEGPLLVIAGPGSARHIASSCEQ